MVAVPMAQDNPVNLFHGDSEGGDVPLDRTWIGAGVEKKVFLDPI